MNQDIATNPDQSARLIACGIDPKNADLCWANIKNAKGNRMLFALPPYNDDDIPAYSLSRILSFFPLEIEDTSGEFTYTFSLSPSKMKDGSVEWEAEYYSHAVDIFLLSESGASPIEACVKAIEWLVNNKHQLNNIEP